ncbi:N-acetyltransferase [Mesorhizobium sp. B2-3-2]|uniref:N-acetyltransferase n=2 Tax=Mesorhizobium TaxID=68287 RepID=UPI001FEDE2BA|nr:N-acetyltransferase [Mesorhizobium sp. B2-3-2]
MPLGDGALAVAYHKVEDGRVALLHTDVPQERSGQGYGSRLAHGVFEALRRDGKRVIAKCPLYPPTPPAPRVRRAPRWLIADGPNVGAHSAWTTIPHDYRMHVQREFLISSAVSDLRVCSTGRAPRPHRH